MQLKRSTIALLASSIILLVASYLLGPEQTAGPVQIGTAFIESPPAQLLVSTLCMLGGAFAAAAGALLIGAVLGTGAAFYKGFFGTVLKTSIDILGSIPRYILIIFLFSLYGKGFGYLIVGVAMACVPTTAENIRNHIAEQLAQGRYRAFLAHGLSPTKILWIHFLYYAGRQVMLRDLLTIFTIFLITETSISYLDPYVYLNFSATWGMMLSRLLHEQPLTHLQTWIVVGWFCIALFSLTAFRRRLGATR